jgi:hypothetical protein
MDPSRARRILAARLIALFADLLQIVLLPIFAPGAASPFNDALDVAVAALLVWLVGWNWAFVPSLAAELVPGLDLFPTWTMAVLFATRKPKMLPVPGNEGEKTNERL